MLLLMRWCILCLFVLSFAPTVRAQTDERCFDETGYCMSGRIREYWEQNGGLPVFGHNIHKLLATPRNKKLTRPDPVSFFTVYAIRPTNYSLRPTLHGIPC